MFPLTLSTLEADVAIGWLHVDKDNQTFWTVHVATSTRDLQGKPQGLPEEGDSNTVDYNWVHEGSRTGSCLFVFFSDRVCLGRFLKVPGLPCVLARCQTQSPEAEKRRGLQDTRVGRGINPKPHAHLRFAIMAVASTEVPTCNTPALHRMSTVLTITWGSTPCVLSGNLTVFSHSRASSSE